MLRIEMSEPCMAATVWYNTSQENTACGIRLQVSKRGEYLIIIYFNIFILL